MDMEKMRVGVIGTGNISNCHLDGYRSNPNVEIYALCDINEARVKEKGEKYNVTRLYTDYNEMLKLPELDAVSVCTWNKEHAAAVIAALNAGKHVLCEKPMAMNATEALEMQRVAKENNKLLMIGFVRRYGNDAALLKDFVDAGTLGDIYYAKVSYLRRAGFPGGWFGNKEFSGGGPLIDLGVHVIDFARYFMGSPKAVSVSGVTFQKLGSRDDLKSEKGWVASDHGNIFNVEDFATALIRFDNGAVLSVETSFSLNLKQDCGTIEFFGTKAGAKLSPELEIFTDINGHPVNITPAESSALSFSGLFDKEINHFVDCVRNQIPCLSPAEEGVELMRIIDAIYESAATGKDVVIQ